MVMTLLRGERERGLCSRHCRRGNPCLRAPPEGGTGGRAWGKLQMHVEQRKRAKVLDQRRVLGVEAEISMRGLHVGGVDMVRLIPCGGVPVCHQQKLQKDDGNQSCNGNEI